EALVTEFCGPADRAAHTSFEGVVEVAFAAAAPGAPPVVGVSPHEVTVDFRPHEVHRAATEARAAEGARALAFMGIDVATDPLPGGLVVAQVAAGSRAERAGVAAGDVLTSLDRVRLTSLADAVPAGTRATVELGVRSGEGAAPRLVQVPIDGLHR